MSIFALSDYSKKKGIDFNFNPNYDWDTVEHRIKEREIINTINELIYGEMKMTQEDITVLLEAFNVSELDEGIDSLRVLSNFIEEVDIEEVNHVELEEFIVEYHQSKDDFKFNINGTEYRLIKKEAIDEIMKDELEDDTYMLGQFNADFIEGITKIPAVLIDETQKSGSNKAIESIGELMAEKIDEVVEKYVEADGYGHHFNKYDGETIEFEDYYAFRAD